MYGRIVISDVVTSYALPRSHPCLAISNDQGSQSVHPPAAVLEYAYEIAMSGKQPLRISCSSLVPPPPHIISRIPKINARLARAWRGRFVK